MSNIKKFENFQVNEYTNIEDKTIQNYNQGILYLKRAMAYLQYTKTDFMKNGKVPRNLSEFIDFMESSDFKFGVQDLENEIDELKNNFGE